MGSRSVTLLAVALSAIQAGCATADRAATKSGMPLSHLGNISFGQPRVGTLRVVVPVEYSGDDRHTNSAIAPYKIESRLQGKEIEITVLASLGGGAENGHRLVLPASVNGRYTVFYLDPDGSRHEVGVIEIPDSL